MVSQSRVSGARGRC